MLFPDPLRIGLFFCSEKCSVETQIIPKNFNPTESKTLIFSYSILAAPHWHRISIEDTLERVFIVFDEKYLWCARQWNSYRLANKRKNFLDWHTRLQFFSTKVVVYGWCHVFLRANIRWQEILHLTKLSKLYQFFRQKILMFIFRFPLIFKLCFKEKDNWQYSLKPSIYEVKINVKFCRSILIWKAFPKNPETKQAFLL